MVRKGEKMKLANHGVVFDGLETGFFSPDLTPLSTLDAGQIGYLATNLKDIHQVTVGDTIVA